MKKMIKIAFVAAFAAIAGYGVYANQKSEVLSDLTLANVEALAGSGETTIALNPQLHSRSATYIKRNGLLIRKITIKSSRPFQCAYHPLTP